MDELKLLRKILEKMEAVSQTMEDVDRRLRSVEAGVEFMRETFETNGKQISIVQDTLADHAREISDIGFEVRGTPVPKKAAAKFVGRKG